MKRADAAQRWIIAGLLTWLAILSCRTSDLLARAEPTATQPAPTVRPTFTRVPPTIPPTDSPPPPTNPPPTTARPPTARPQPTRVPIKPVVPATPAPPPTPDLDAGWFFRVTKIACVASNDTRIEGNITSNGQPINNIWVRVSSTPHGPKAIDDTLTGYNPADYKHVDPSFNGKYRLGITEGARMEGNWFVFTINDAGEPMSRPIQISTTKEAGCNTGIVDFAH